MFEASAQHRSAAPNAHAGAGPEASARLLDVNFGLFVHYVPELTVDSSGRVASLAQLVEEFDVDAFVRDLVKFGVEYVRFTAWHQGMHPLYPSAVMKRRRGNSSHSERDLIAEIIRALAGTGISLQLYTHPRDGHDMNRVDQDLTGWGNSAPPGDPNPDPRTFNFETWNEFICEVYSELVARYGRDVETIYLDEGSERADSEWVVDYPRLRETIRAGAPNILVQQNYYGSLYTADLADHEYCHWGELTLADADLWPAYRTRSVSAVVGDLWYASNPGPSSSISYKPRDFFRYLVLQTSANLSGGGLALAAGPFADNGWEPGVQGFLEAVGSMVAPVRRSIIGTRPSSRWPTMDRATIASLTWGGVATEDPQRTYLHILRPPADSVIRLPRSSDGSVPRTVRLLLEGIKLETVQVDGATHITVLPELWDEIDTVLELTF